MKTKKNASTLPRRMGQLLFASLLGLILPAHAQLVTIDMVMVGDANNNAASATNTSHGQTAAYGYGSVGYEYQIGKYMVTNNQYATFLNAVAASDPYGLYNTNMASVAGVAGITRSGTFGSYTYEVISGRGNAPVAYVNWFDAARFTNWLHNGATAGASTETGAYTLNEATSGIITKDVNAQFWIPSEDEWYKAAYYNPTLNSGTGQYFLHANGSDSMTSNDFAFSGSANYRAGDYATTPGNDTYSSSTYYLTDVGAYENTENYYGTFDQAGLLFEWNDAVVSSNRGFRGGSWGGDEFLLRSSYRGSGDPTTENGSIGFRVAAIPEPGSLFMMGLSGLAVVLGLRRRKS